MATIEQTNSEKDELENLLEEISKYTPDMLLREDLGPKLNFEKGIPIFQKFLNLYSELRLCELDSIPSDKLSALLSPIIPKAKDTLEGLKLIKNFTPSKYPNPDEEVDKIIGTSIKNYGIHWEKIMSLITMSTRRAIGSEYLLQETKKNIKELNNLRKNTEKNVEEILREAKEGVEKISELAGEAGVAFHAKAFEKIAKEYNEKTKYWLNITKNIVGVIVLFGLFFVLLYYLGVEKIPKDTPEAIYRSIPKIIILSALYYALVWSAKNYNANHHNYIVNKHRRNALQTFETFIKAASVDPDTKNAVILQTTQSIFSVQPSGYVHKDSESESPYKLIELIRTVGSSSSK